MLTQTGCGLGWVMMVRVIDSGETKYGSSGAAQWRRRPVSPRTSGKRARENAKMPKRRTRSWSITCSETDFAKHRNDPAFHQLVALGRLLNALQFVFDATPKRFKRTPAGLRQRVNSLFFFSAVLFEGWKLINRMAQHYRGDPTWPRGFGSILSNREYEQLISTSFKPLRNLSVFHFAEDEIGNVLRAYPVDEPEVALATGRGVGPPYYQLADMLAVGTWLDIPLSHSELEVRLRAVIA